MLYMYRLLYIQFDVMLLSVTTTHLQYNNVAHHDHEQVTKASHQLMAQDLELM